jgi:tRNA/tmRNA/rRNA uracil-C5-methylase (TrmA/RlmC/RlmD family)
MASALAESGIAPLADLPHAKALAVKYHRVESALRQRGLEAEVAAVHPSPRRVGARARVKLRVGPEGRLGFFRPGTHTFVAVPLDDLVRPEVALYARELEASGGARGTFELRSDGERVVVNAERSFAGPADLAVLNRRIRGNPTLTIDGLRVSAGSFYQVNLELNRLLVERVDLALQELAPTALLDLYGGVGNLSLRAAQRGVRVTLAESSNVALADARHNLAGTAATVVKVDAGRLRAGDHVADVVLLDPPRAGAPGVLAELALGRPRAFVYVSCDPVSLARDLATVPDYHIASVEPWDMFPGTDHVETLVVLVRGAAKRLR